MRLTKKALFGLIWTSLVNLCWAHVPVIDSVQLDLGMGYNPISGKSFARCIESDLGNTETVAPIPEGSTVEKTSSGQMVYRIVRATTTSSELESALGLTADVNLGFPSASFQAKTEYLKSHSSKGTHVNFVVRILVLNGVSQAVTRPRLTPEAAALVQAQDFSNFFKTCGSDFIQSKALGGEFIAAFEINTRTEKEQKVVKQELQAKRSDFGANGKIEDRLDRILSNYSHAYWQSRMGGSGPDPKEDAIELLAYSRAFPELVNREKGRPTVVHFQSASYATVFPSLSQAKLKNPINLKDVPFDLSSQKSDYLKLIRAQETTSLELEETETLLSRERAKPIKLFRNYKTREKRIQMLETQGRILRDIQTITSSAIENCQEFPERCNSPKWLFTPLHKKYSKKDPEPQSILANFLPRQSEIQLVVKDSEQAVESAKRMHQSAKEYLSKISDTPAILESLAASFSAKAVSVFESAISPIQETVELKKKQSAANPTPTSNELIQVLNRAAIPVAQAVRLTGLIHLTLEKGPQEHKEHTWIINHSNETIQNTNRISRIMNRNLPQAQAILSRHLAPNVNLSRDHVVEVLIRALVDATEALMQATHGIVQNQPESTKQAYSKAISASESLLGVTKLLVSKDSPNFTVTEQEEVALVEELIKKLDFQSPSRNLRECNSLPYDLRIALNSGKKVAALAKDTEGAFSKIQNRIKVTKDELKTAIKKVEEIDGILAITRWSVDQIRNCAQSTKASAHPMDSTELAHLATIYYQTAMAGAAEAEAAFMGAQTAQWTAQLAKRAHADRKSWGLPTWKHLKRYDLFNISSCAYAAQANTAANTALHYSTLADEFAGTYQRTVSH